MSNPLPELLGHLEARRSVLAMHLSQPGPSRDELRRILTIAARVPDHGKLAPWRFIIIEGDSRAALADRLEALHRAAEPDITEERLAKERAALLASPVIVAVVSCAAPHPKIPEWEQVLSAGAVCLNMLHAAHATGFRAQWLTGWAAYDDAAKAALGLSGSEQVAGLIHIGSSDATPSDRTRPDLDALVTHWRP